MGVETKLTSHPAVRSDMVLGFRSALSGLYCNGYSAQNGQPVMRLKIVLRKIKGSFYEFQQSPD
jgi:hypothetical protein